MEEHEAQLALSSIFAKALKQVSVGLEKQLQDLDAQSPGIINKLIELGWYVRQDLVANGDGFKVSLELVRPWDPCDGEVYSWDIYSTKQIDPYWIRCGLDYGHPGEHEDSNTGATW